jgi:hypothetical protein
MARFIAEYPNPFGWNPTQYFGLPTQMWYLPGIPYTAALGIKLLPFLKPEHVYRLIVTTLACIVPATVYLFAAYFSRSRKYALLAALCYTFCSPAYFYFWQIDLDRGLAQVPWRIQILLKYGEGPHNAGLALLPLALIAAWRTATRRSHIDVVVAAVLFAFIALTNWIAAMSLGWCCLMMMLAAAGTAHETGFRARRLFTAGFLAYLLACFWLTPEFIRTVAFNWPKDAFGFRMQGSKVVVLAALLLAPVMIRLGFLRVTRSFYPCFLTLSAFGFSFVTFWHYWYDLGPIPESRRYAPEAELFVLLFLFELLRRIMLTPYPVRVLAPVLAVHLAGMGIYQIWRYPYAAWIMLRPDRRERFIEYKVATALHEFHPRGRVLVSGGTRFRLNSWYLLPQVGGTFESGLTNRTSIDILYSLRTGIGVPPETRTQDAINQLRFSGVEYVAVHGVKSREHWRDMTSVLPWDTMLERVWHEEDDYVYRVPFTGYAHLIRAGEGPAYVPIGPGLPYLKPLINALDDPRRQHLDSRWHGSSRMTIEGAIPSGYLVFVQVSHHAGWRAYQNDVSIHVEKSPAGYLVLHPTPADRSIIDLRFVGSTQQKTFTALSFAACLAVLVTLLRKRPKSPRLIL